jgi:hypothetical protein
MPRLTITLRSKRPWGGVGLAVAALLSILFVLIGLSMLPGILFGTTLTPTEAEESIRRHLLLRAVGSFDQRSKPIGDSSDASRARYAAAFASLKSLEFVSVDVDTVIFSAFRISRSFVVRVEMRGKDQEPSTRYFCFLGKYLTGECSRWNWSLAW